MIDGYIRSDNRGSESIFPLWLTPNPKRLNAGTRADVDLRRLLPYAYAIFHSSTYRERYAEPLTSQFPRIPPPPSQEIFEELAALGLTLIDSHLLRGPFPTTTVQLVGDVESAVAPGYPKFFGDAVAIAPGAQFESISAAAWQFQVGAHQVLRKWLKDRRGRRLSPNDIAHYIRIIASVERTLAIIPQIDTAVSFLRQPG